MSESLAISLALEWKIFFFSFSLRLLVKLFLTTGLVLISCNSGSKSFKISAYNDVHNYQKNLIAHVFLLHQVLLEIYKTI